MARLLRPTGKWLKDLSLPSAAKSPRWMGASSFVTLKESLLNVPTTRVTKLDNGLRVATQDNGSPTATVGLWMNTGSRFENDENNGVAHFFEHMAFKGTKKRSQTDLELEVENRGASFDAHTGRDMSTYSAKCLSEDVPKVVEILSDVIQNSKLDESEIEKQKGVILREMDDIDNNDLKLVTFNYLHNIAFQGTPLGRSVIGTTNNVNKLIKQDLVDYVKGHFKAPRMVLAGAGGVEHEALVRLAEEHFKSLEWTYEADVPEQDICRFTGSMVTARDDALPYAHIAVAVDGVGYGDEDNIPLTIASNIVGSWDTTHGGGVHNASRIAQVVAKEHLCLGFQSFNLNYRDNGLWGVYMVCDRMTIDDCLSEVQAEWMRLCHSVSDFEVQRGKNILKANILQQSEGTTNICEDIGRQVLYCGRRVPLQELFENIDAVNADIVKDACYRHIYDKCPAVAAVGPTEQVPDYNLIRGLMYQLRV